MTRPVSEADARTCKHRFAAERPEAFVFCVMAQSAFLPQRARTAFRAMADRLAAERLAARAFPPLDAPRRDRATACWLRVSIGSGGSGGACPVASWTICQSS